MDLVTVENLQRKKNGLTAAILALLLSDATTEAKDMEHWAICTGPALATDTAVGAAIEDLQLDGGRFGLTFEPVTESPGAGNVLFLGDAGRNPHVEQAGLELEGVEDPQGYEIRTQRTGNDRLVVVAGGSVLGDVYGLYWIWDRIRVLGRLPDLNLQRSPVLAVRHTEANTREEFRNALRFTANWVAGHLVDDLVPWDSEPEATRNAAQREQLSKLIDAAHDYHLKYLTLADELSYHPTLLEEFGATLDPSDPKLWDALQAKYRRLLNALPGLDGVRIRSGELTRITGSYRSLDLMHQPTECDWPLDRRYRTFLQKIHEVVVGEFDKIYFHRTWVTNTDEQHSNPAVYRQIFTDDVPTRNLYLAPYLSTADRWYYQPYNPTFNLTPHHMVVLLSILDYHTSGGINVFPSFPGQYHLEGVRGILAADQSNLRGVHFNIPPQTGWDTRTLTAYVAYRLAWDPDADERTLAEEYAAIYCGREAAPVMAEILLLSQEAYKDGIYIKPVAEGLSWNTLPHLRLNIFEAKGYPMVDGAKAHVDWLRTMMYEPCKSRIDEALDHLDRGREAARHMEALYAPVAPRIEDSRLGKQVGESLALTRLLVEINNLYTRTCFAYFQYREATDPDTQEHLTETVAALKKTRAEFIAAPGFEYKLFGIDQLLLKADEALADLSQAEAALVAAPDAEATLRAIASHQEKHAAAVASLPGNAVRLLRWRGRVDGKDLLSIRGDVLSIEHIQDDPIHSDTHEFFDSLPRREVTVLVRDVESRPIHPFVAAQPTGDNDYTFTLYIADRRPGYAWLEVELFYVDKLPEELGLAVPWQAAAPLEESP